MPAKAKQLPKPEDVKEFTISRKRWLRGTDGGKQKSCLYKPHDRTMCCLGFYGRSLGATVDDIKAKLEPSNTVNDNSFNNWPAWLLDEYLSGQKKSSPIGTELMGVNDRDNLSETEREARVIAIFAEHGVTVHFVD